MPTPVPVELLPQGLRAASANPRAVPANMLPEELRLQTAPTTEEAPLQPAKERPGFFGSAAETVKRLGLADEVAAYSANPTKENRDALLAKAQSKYESVGGFGKGENWEYVKELLGNFVGYIAAPSIAATTTGAAVGAVTGPGAIVTAPVAGAVAGYTTMGTQNYIENVVRQAEEQKAAEEAGKTPQELSVAKAGAAAVGQTALDAVGLKPFRPLLRRLPFVKNLVGASGDEAAKKAEDVLRKALAEGKLTYSRGMARGAVEGMVFEVPTEVAQQALERWQAGLPLGDDNAKQEYLQAAAGAAVLGGFLGAPSGAIKTRAERKRAEGLDKKAEAEKETDDEIAAAAQAASRPPASPYAGTPEFEAVVSKYIESGSTREDAEYYASQELGLPYGEQRVDTGAGGAGVPVVGGQAGQGSVAEGTTETGGEGLGGLKPTPIGAGVGIGVQPPSIEDALDQVEADLTNSAFDYEEAGVDPDLVTPDVKQRAALTLTESPEVSIFDAIVKAYEDKAAGLDISGSVVDTSVSKVQEGEKPKKGKAATFTTAPVQVMSLETALNRVETALADPDLGYGDPEAKFSDKQKAEAAKRVSEGGNLLDVLADVSMMKIPTGEGITGLTAEDLGAPSDVVSKPVAKRRVPVAELPYTVEDVTNLVKEGMAVGEKYDPQFRPAYRVGLEVGLGLRRQPANEVLKRASAPWRNVYKEGVKFAKSRAEALRNKYAVERLEPTELNKPDIIAMAEKMMKQKRITPAQLSELRRMKDNTPSEVMKRLRDYETYTGDLRYGKATGTPIEEGRLQYMKGTVEDTNPAKALIDKLYAENEKWPFQGNQFVYVHEQNPDGEVTKFTRIELVPYPSKNNDVAYLDWISSYPMGQGLGSIALENLQREARALGVSLRLHPWDKGVVSKTKLTRFYKRHGFKKEKDSEAMVWSPEEEGKAASKVMGQVKGDLTSEQIENGDVHAKEVGGTVVYRKGDMGLIRGYSVLTGQPVYAAFMGDRRTTKDVDSYTGQLFSEEQLAELKDKKAEIEAVDAQKHKTDPFVKYNADNLAVSENVPAKIAGIFAEWKSILTPGAKIYLADVEDIRANKDSYTGKMRAVVSALLDPSDLGTARKVGDNEYYITVSRNSSTTKTLELLAHELGHIHEKEAFRTASPEMQAALRADHMNWLASQKDKTARELITSLRNRVTGRTIQVPEGMPAANLTSYWKSFSEWYADQTSKWAMSDEKPVSAVEKFFAKLGKALRKFYQTLRGQGYLPTETFRKYMEEATKNLQLTPGETREMMAAEREEFKAQPVKRRADRIIPQNPNAAKTFLRELGLFSNQELSDMSGQEAIDRAAKIGIDKEWMDYFNSRQMAARDPSVTKLPQPDMTEYMPDVSDLMSQKAVGKVEENSQQVSTNLGKVKLATTVSDVIDATNRNIVLRAFGTFKNILLGNIDTFSVTYLRGFSTGLPATAIYNWIRGISPDTHKVMLDIRKNVELMGGRYIRFLRAAEKMAKKIDDFRRKHGLREIGELMHLGRLVGSPYEYNTLEEALKNDKVMKKYTEALSKTPTTSSEYAAYRNLLIERRMELKELYDARQKLDAQEGGKELYLEIRDFYKRMYTISRADINRQSKKVYGEEGGESILQEIRKQEEVAKNTPHPKYSLMTQEDMVTDYFPFKRHGDYWLRLDIPQMGVGRVAMSFDTAQERDDVLNALAKKYNFNPNPKDDSVKFGHDRDEFNQLIGRDSAFLKKIFDVIEKNTQPDVIDKGYKNQAEMQNAIRKQLKDQIYQVYLMTLPEQSIRKQFMHSKDIAGFSGDIARNFATSALAFAGQNARMRYGSDVENAIANSYAATESLPPYTRERVNILIDEIANRARNQVIPQDQNAVVTLLNRMAFTWLLTSAATAIIQPTAIPIRLMPALWSRYGVGAGNAMWGKYLKVWDVIRFDKGWPTIETSPLVKNNPINARAFEAMDQRGVFTETQTSNIMRTGPSAAKGKSSRSLTEVVSEVMSYGFISSELVTRQIAAMMTFELEYAKTKNFDESVETAISTMLDTIGDFSEFERPSVLQSSVARSVFLFKMHAVNQIKFFLQTTGRWLRQNNDPEVRIQARNELAGVLLMGSLFFGAVGMPMYSIITALIDAFNDAFDDDDEARARSLEDPYAANDSDYRFRFKFMEKHFGDLLLPTATGEQVSLADVLTYGPLSTLTGANIGPRVAFDGMVFRSGVRGDNTREDVINTLLANLGPTVSLGDNALKAYDDFQNGKIMQGLERILPAFFKAPMTAYRMETEGVVSKGNDQLFNPKDISEIETLIHLAGFSSFKVAERQKQIAARRDQVKMYERTVKNLLRRRNEALFNADAGGLLAAEKAIMKFNNRMADPKLQIGKEQRESSWESYQKIRGSSFRGSRLTDETRPYDVPDIIASSPPT